MELNLETLAAVLQGEIIVPSRVRNEVDFVPRGQSRVVLFVEPVLRTAVVVSLLLARGPRAVFEFATRMSERTIKQHRCIKRRFDFTKIRYRRKTFQPNNRNYR